MTWTRRLAGAQAAYYMVTGAWPLLHRASFERVTGPKEDFWLVRTVGGLALATGIALGIAVARGERTPEMLVLAATTGVVFAAADVRAAKTESRSYLGDVVLQAAFAPAWFRGWN